MALAVAQACTDCGDIYDRARLWVYHQRLLCAPCLREASDIVKADAEVWILEQLFSRSAA